MYWVRSCDGILIGETCNQYEKVVELDRFPSGFLLYEHSAEHYS
jgi:hypothetical protein